MTTKVKFWGVRDQIPITPQPAEICSDLIDRIHHFLQTEDAPQGSIGDFLSVIKAPTLIGHGSASTCVEVSEGSTRLIIDGGSGIKRLGDACMVQRALSQKGPFEYHILLSSFKMDRLIGLPFFTPIFIPQSVIHFYSVNDSAEEAIRFLFTKPYFPVGFHQLQSKIHFHILRPLQPTSLGSFQITPFLIHVKDDYWSFKIRTKQNCYIHGSGPICTDEVPIKKIFEKKIDLIYIGAQMRKRNRVSSDVEAIEAGLKLGKNLKAKQIVFGHYHPNTNMAELDAVFKKTKKLSHLPNEIIDFAFEEQTIEL